MASPSAPSSADIERLQQELRQMKSTVHFSLRDILAQKDQEIARVTHENQRLSSTLGEQHAIAEQALAKLSDFRGTAAAMSQLEAQRYGLEQQLSQKDAKVEMLRRDLAAAQTQIDRQNTIFRRLEQSEAERQVGLRAEITSIQPRVTELAALADTLQQSLDTCTSDLTLARREYERLFSEHQTLQVDSSRLRQDNAALRARAEESELAEASSLAFKRRLRDALPEMTNYVEATLRAMDDTIAMMRAEADVSSRERSDQAKQLAAQSHELLTLHSERQRTADLQAAQSGMRTALSELHAQLQANGTQFAQLRELVVQAAEESKPLRELAHKEDELQRLTGELEAVQMRYRTAESDRAQWHRHAGEARGAVLQLEKEVHARDAEIARLREEERRACENMTAEHQTNVALQENVRAVDAQLAEMRRVLNEEVRRAAEAREHLTRLEAQKRASEEKLSAVQCEVEVHARETARVQAELLVERATRRQEAEVNAQLKQLVEKMRAQLAGLLEPS